MPLNKAKGNMYKWVTHTWNPVQMNCPHECEYCYVKKHNRRFQNNEIAPQLITPFPELGKDKTIFVEHFGDLFAFKMPYSQAVPYGWIEQVLFHCAKYPDNVYVFQTKNPGMIYFLHELLPPKKLIGATIETNRQEILDELSKAPPVLRRMRYMSDIVADKFVNIEPIIKFDPGTLAAIVINCRPKFVSIGADSKKSNLPEPKKQEIIELIELLKEAEIEIRLKDNLKRLTGDLK